MIPCEWFPTRDGDPDAHRLYARHYSRPVYRDGRRRRLFVGPGEKRVLVTSDGLAMFVWRRFIDDCSLGGGVNCAAFRNEGGCLSSALILQADAYADRVWPHEVRHYTYVDPSKIRSSNPGCCFKHAGWRQCGQTKGGLLCLERMRGAA